MSLAECSDARERRGPGCKRRLLDRACAVNDRLIRLSKGCACHRRGAVRWPPARGSPPRRKCCGCAPYCGFESGAGTEKARRSGFFANEGSADREGAVSDRDSQIVPRTRAPARSGGHAASARLLCTFELARAVASERY